MRCVDCSNFASAEKIAPGFARLGLGKCNVTDLAPATFLTAIYARECASFSPAPADVVAKRIEFLGHKEVTK